MPGGTIGWGFDIVSILTAAGSLIVLQSLRRGVSGVSA
jgi:hypothetical protein